MRELEPSLDTASNGADESLESSAAASDMDLLRAYADGQNEAAFAELVARHLDWVYSTALRQVGNAVVAQDVTQAVFVILAHKAKALTQGTVLAGWLFRAVRYAVLEAARMEKRRLAREQEAVQMQLTNTPDESQMKWERWAPMLDDALASLNARDRDAVLLRYFEKKPFAEVGETLGCDQNAARVRVVRATEKLRRYFVRRGVAVTALAVGSALTTHTVHAAPAVFAQGITVSGNSLGNGASEIVHAVLRRIFWRKVQVCAAVALAVCMLSGLAMMTVQQRQKRMMTAASSQTLISIDQIVRAVDQAFTRSEPETFVGLIHFRNAAEEQFRPALFDYIRATGRFRSEIRRLIGRESNRVFEALLRETFVPQPAVMPDRITADRATAKLYPWHSLQLVRVAGEWKWAFFADYPTEAGRDERMKLLQHKTRILDELSSALRSGAITDVSEAVRAFQNSVP